LTLNAAIDGRLPIDDNGDIKLRVDASYQSSVFFATTNTGRLSQSGYALLNGRLGWQSKDEGIELYFWVRNLTNQRYANDIVALEDFGFDQIVYGDPRTFGIGLTFGF
jgi:iron complex outermembrane receptor protein